MSRLGYVFIFSITILHGALILVQGSEAERRVLSGKPYSTERGYVVYLIKATTETRYDAWTCGGSIVTPSLIVTSAACVEDVKHTYAIAGYSKYVTYENLDKDPCTREKKKKIVYVCIPSEYTFDYPKIEQWAKHDIAVVKVESPYDFSDASYKTYCSYIPSTIEINYDNPELEKPGTNGIVFGWGHSRKWRSISDTTDYNEATLRYGSIKLANKEECKKEYEPPIQTIIDKHMICSIEEGIFDDQGGLLNDTIDQSKLLKECGPGLTLRGGSCQLDDDFSRRSNINATDNVNITRRRGICQNDHGGPLIAWRGPKEILIGVASVFKVEQGSNQCIPPFLYTSTHCSGSFLRCLLKEHEQGYGSSRPYRKSFDFSQCLKPPKELGFEIIRRTISWIGHPDGPAENEIYDGIKIEQREHDSPQTQNNQRKPDKDDEKKSESQHSKVNLAPKIGEKKSETELVENQEEPDDVIQFSDILPSHQEEKSRDVKNK